MNGLFLLIAKRLWGSENDNLAWARKYHTYDSLTSYDYHENRNKEET